MSEPGGGSSSQFACLFCGRTDRQRSREHVLRDKFNQIAISPFLKPQLTTRRSLDDGEYVKTVRQVGVYDVTINEVCRDCNQGWLNDLENAVEPFLTFFLTGGRTDYVDPDAYLLGLWMVTRALLRTCTEGRSHRAPASLFREVYERRRVPRGTLVHYALAEAVVLDGGQYTWARFGPEDSAAAPAATVAPADEDYVALVSYCVGNLFFQVFLCGGSDSSRQLGPITFREIRGRHPQSFQLIAPFDNATYGIQTTPLKEQEVIATGAALRVLLSTIETFTD